MLEQDKHSTEETLCPHCGGSASWAYSDTEETQVQVLCADCGRLDMTRAEFDCTEADIADPSEAEVRSKTAARTADGTSRAILIGN